MRLKTKLVLSATGLTFAIVLVLSALFVSELLRQRIEQTAAANDVLAHEVWLEMRKAVETGLRANPPADRSDEALHSGSGGCVEEPRGVGGCDEYHCALLADGAGRERDGCPWNDIGEYRPGCAEPASGFPVQPGGCAEWDGGTPDEGCFWKATGAGYLAGAGSEWSSVSGGSRGCAIDIFEERI